MKRLLFFLILIFAISHSIGQPANCVLKPPFITIHFGSGNVRDINSTVPYNYERIDGSCPNDGYYTYTSYTNNCFHNTWLSLTEDHTLGDVSGNMMIVNASYNTGVFLTTTLNGLKSNTTYEFALWLMNVCWNRSNCPTLLLPNLTVELKTPAGKTVARFGTGEIPRIDEPKWQQYRAFFTMPTSETSLVLVMSDNNPGGCGNDFALDDITVRECVPPIVATNTPPKKAVVIKKTQSPSKPPIKKTTAALNTQPPKVNPIPIKKDSLKTPAIVLKNRPIAFPPPPSILTSRTNELVKKFETGAGEIKIDLYDNGEIDGDSVSIYHNNVLLMSHARLSQKPITFRIVVNSENPHHELIMVAENLGTIPPNTSLMIITSNAKRYQAFISSTEQKNAKVVLDLKE